jgi:hypothetical protein
MMNITKMKYSFCVVLILMMSCGDERKEAGTKSVCPALPVSVSISDSINADEDAEFGVGDDGLFTAREPQFFSNGNEAPGLSDYNLQSAWHDQFNGSSPDTLMAVIAFTGFDQPDTAILINEMFLFNGDRKNLNSWQGSGKIKNIRILFHEQCIGTAVLENTLKMQTINLKNNQIPIKSGMIDTIKIIVAGLHGSSKKSTNYSISEIGFSGIRYY